MTVLILARNARKLTKLQFIDRFTPAEQAGIYAAESASAEVRAWLERMRAAAPDPGSDKAVDLDDPRLAPALDVLVAAGLLAPERPAEILA